MPKIIKDKYSKLEVSRQYRYQLRKRALDRCIICGKQKVTANFCLEHAIERRERQRKRLNSKRRLKSLTYRLLDGAKKK